MRMPPRRKYLFITLSAIAFIASCSRIDPLEKAVRTEGKFPIEDRTLEWYAVHTPTRDAVVQVCDSNAVQYHSTRDCSNAKDSLFKSQMASNDPKQMSITTMLLKQALAAHS
jgi:hypothetical protein